MVKIIEYHLDQIGIFKSFLKYSVFDSKEG
jgi:hypothetical protein